MAQSGGSADETRPSSSLLQILENDRSQPLNSLREHLFTEHFLLKGNNILMDFSVTVFIILFSFSIIPKNGLVLWMEKSRLWVL